MEKIYEKLKSITKEENILVDELMSKHTTFKTGGKADYFVTVFQPHNIAQIV